MIQICVDGDTGPVVSEDLLRRVAGRLQVPLQMSLQMSLQMPLTVVATQFDRHLVKVISRQR